MKQRYYLYGLKCPIDKDIKYIGMTINTPRRYSEHIQNIKPKSEKGLWISSLIKNGLFPELIVFKEIKCTKKQAMTLETELIISYRKTGKTLFNRAEKQEGHALILNLPSEIYEALRKISYEKNVSMTSIIIEAIQKHLKKSK